LCVLWETDTDREKVLIFGKKIMGFYEIDKFDEI
jgi:hypothetical protein